MATEGNGDLPVPDLRTMEELCQPSLNGRGRPIASISIQATNFVLKTDMIQQVQNSCQFHGLSGDVANKHLDKFLHVTQSIKVNGVIEDALRLYLFPHSLIHHATAWFDRLPRNSIQTFEPMAKMFLGKYFPPSMVTKLRNKITNFRQRPDESLFEAWECYKLLIDRCPNHNMLPVTQIDTFYNGLTLRHHDNINAAGGTFMKRRPKECYDLIKNMTAHHNDWDTSAQRSESSSSITSSSYTKIAALKAEMPPLAKPRTYMLREPIKANDAILKNMQTNMTSLTNSNLELKNMFGQFMKMNTASSSGSGTIPGNTITNPQEELKGITTRSGTAYQGPTIPTTSSSLPPVVECETEVTKDTVPPTNNGSTKDVQPPVFQTESPIVNSEPVVAPIIEPIVAPVTLANLGASINLMPLSVWNKLSLPDMYPMYMTLKLVDRSISRPVGVVEDVFVKVGTFHFLADFVVVDFDADPRVPLILERSFLKTERDLIDVFEGELTLCVGKEAITFNLDQTSRYSTNYNDMTANRIDVIDIACEEYSQEVLGFSDVIASGNPTLYYDPIVSTSFLTLTPFGESDFLLEEVDAFLALEDDELKIYEAKTDKSSIVEPPEVKLKDIPPHIKYAFLEGDDKLPIIIAKDLSDEEKTALITVLESHKRAIIWKLSDIRGIDPEFCTHKILMEDDFEPAVQHHRRVNPKIYDVIKQEVLKLLDAGLIYPISDSPYVIPVHYVPKKGGFAVVENEESELIPTHLEKSHFMVKEGIVLGHKISKNEIKVDKAKVDVITKLPHPTTIKGIRSFLGYAGFYRCFIKDFSKIARPMTCLLGKDTLFFLSKECVEAFQTLKRKLTEAPILFAPDWDLPFELMCDGSDFAIGVYMARKPLTFSRLTTMDPPGDIMAQTTLPRSYRVSPQTSGQVEVSNCGLKRIIEKTVGKNHASWLDKLDDALWAFRTAYKTPIGCTPYKLVYKKACHLPIELEHKAYWALKHANFDLQTAGDHKKVQLNELRDQSYENSLIYKEKTNRLHDSKIKDRVFNIGDRVLLFNSRLNIFSGKLKTRWSGPFTITHVFSYGTIGLSQTNGPNFKVNGHRLKHYFGEDIPKIIVPDLQTFPKDQ
uniref:Reverse transcriptase domain-containing protein n=1 Tax=Tanacetum cinerariifolium TaxID=118510 RepID=A0A6L2MM09_TANCI|nr:reverse transcriptase domain-containing protein [Tanacetum cinerariifolium]